MRAIIIIWYAQQRKDTWCQLNRRKKSEGLLGKKRFHPTHFYHHAVYTGGEKIIKRKVIIRWQTLLKNVFFIFLTGQYKFSFEGFFTFAPCWMVFSFCNARFFLTIFFSDWPSLSPILHRKGEQDKLSSGGGTRKVDYIVDSFFTPGPPSSINERQIFSTRPLSLTGCQFRLIFARLERTGFLDLKGRKVYSPIRWKNGDNGQYNQLSLEWSFKRLGHYTAAGRLVWRLTVIGF